MCGIVQWFGMEFASYVPESLCRGPCPMKNKNGYTTLRKLIFSSMILVPVIPFALILGVGYYYFTTSLETSTIATMKRITEDHRQMIDSFLSERRANLEFILYSYPFDELADPAKLYDVFGQLQKESHTFVDLGIFDEDGIHVAYQGPYRLVGKDYGQEEWFKQVLTNGYYISDIFLGFRRVPHFIIALAREEKNKKWVIRATIDTFMFNELVKKVRIGKTGEAYLLNAEGVFQTERRSGGSLMERNPESLKHESSDAGLRIFIQPDERGDDYLYATTWLANKNWLLVVRQQKADAFKALRSAVYLIILIGIVGASIIVGVAFYMTDRVVRRMEQMDVEKESLSGQLIRATRLAELGEMAAGFAHEINNPLQIIRNEQALMEVILEEMEEKGEIRHSESVEELLDSIRQINTQVQRCAQITQAILKFGRKSEPTLQDVDLRDFMPEVTAMVAQKAAVHGIKLKEEISNNTPPVHGDPAELQQVLLNLFNNAIDAILTKHGSRGGELVVGAKPAENGKAMIFVSDNGCGISTEYQKRIFSPFFTTKPVGQGTGLGLSVCYGIIDKMGGTMQVASEEGVGTTFTIELPAAVQKKASN